MPNYELVAKNATREQRRVIEALFTPAIKARLGELTKRGKLSADHTRFSLSLEGRLPREVLDKELNDLASVTSALSEQLRGAAGLYR